jgi:hypothetical protein
MVTGREGRHLMTDELKTPQRGRFARWLHDTFHDIGFRTLIGPAQTQNAVHGASQYARDQWKRDLEARKAYTRTQRARRRAAR